MKQPGLDLGHEIVVDLFAGGGGASLGIEWGMGRPVDVAVNHDRDAVAMHQVNHPRTTHYCESVFKVDPVRATGHQPVGLLWASPDCTHHSRAKGGKPVKKKLRGLAWVVVKWARRTRPRVIMLENVEEFADWGPLTPEGKPCPVRKGQQFQEWIRQLERLGYQVEHRTLRACDYGAPTIRKRLFVIARCDGRPIVWPEPTHGDPDAIARTEQADAEERRNRRQAAGGRTPVGRSGARAGVRDGVENAREADRHAKSEGLSSDLHYDERESSRPNGAQNRLDRSARSAGAGGADQPQERGEDGKRDHEPGAGNVGGEQQSRPQERSLEATVWHTERLHKVDGCPGSGGPEDEEERGQNSRDRKPHGDQRGVRPADSKRGRKKLQPYLTAASCIDWTIPCPSIFERKKPLAENTLKRIAKGVQRFVLDSAEPFLVGIDNKGAGSGCVWSGGEPLRTTTTENRHAVVAPYFIPRHGERTGQEPRTRSAEEPMPAITGTANGASLVAAFMEQANTGMVGHPITEPVSTIVGKGCTQRLVAAHLLNQHGSDQRHAPADHPAPTICAGGNHAGLVAAIMAPYYGSGSGETGRDLRDPTPTITSKDRLQLVTVTIEGTEYVLTDIGMRMLAPRELYRAQGFPDSYVIDRAPDGRRLTKTAQVKLCGNSVPPHWPRALVQANFAHEQKLREVAA